MLDAQKIESSWEETFVNSAHRLVGEKTASSHGRVTEVGKILGDHTFRERLAFFFGDNLDDYCV